MNSIHEITLPSKVLIGPGAIKRIHDVVSGIPRVPGQIGIVTGENTYKAGGRIVEEMLSRDNSVVTWFASDASVSTAEKQIGRAHV